MRGKGQNPVNDPGGGRERLKVRIGVYAYICRYRQTANQTDRQSDRQGLGA